MPGGCETAYHAEHFGGFDSEMRKWHKVSSELGALMKLGENRVAGIVA